MSLIISTLEIWQSCRIMQYIVTLVRLSVFANVYTTLANNPCDRIAGIPYIDSALGWLTAIVYWLALPCLFYTLLNALVPSNTTEGDNAQSMYSVVANSGNSSDMPAINSQRQISSKNKATNSVDELMTFLSFSFTKAIVILEDTMGWVFKSYLVDLEVMGSEEVRIIQVETSSEVPTFKGENMLSKDEYSYWQSCIGAGLPWFKVCVVMLV